MMQLCLRCGRHELAGSFCSFCRTAEYDLADHEHGRDDGNGCPLGSHLDPLDTSVGHIRAHLAKPAGDWLGPVVIRHHPRTAGYTVACDAGSRKRGYTPFPPHKPVISHPSPPSSTRGPVMPLAATYEPVTESRLQPADWARVATQLDLLADSLEASDPYIADAYRRNAALIRAEHFAGILRDLEKEEQS
jgi:hypothetical protein